MTTPAKSLHSTTPHPRYGGARLRQDLSTIRAHHQPSLPISPLSHNLVSCWMGGKRRVGRELGVCSSFCVLMGRGVVQKSMTQAGPPLEGGGPLIINPPFPPSSPSLMIRVVPREGVL
ncbi:hypothetical protein ACOMHN_062396 [Nucella lapillus]